MRALAVLASGFAMAPSAQSPSAPSEPHEKLAFFEGEWTLGGANPMQFREVCGWLPHGRRHLVCRASWVGSSGPREGMSVFSYDPATRTYLYTGFRAGGARVLQAARPTAGGWSFEGSSGESESRRRTRTTITRTDEGMRFLEEVAIGDGPFEAAPEVRYVRVKP